MPVDGFHSASPTTFNGSTTNGAASVRAECSTSPFVSLALTSALTPAFRLLLRLTPISSRSIAPPPSPRRSHPPIPTRLHLNPPHLIRHPRATPSLPDPRPLTLRRSPPRRLPRSPSPHCLAVGQITPIKRLSRTAATKLHQATRRDRRSSTQPCSRRIRMDPRCPSRSTLR